MLLAAPSALAGAPRCFRPRAGAAVCLSALPGVHASRGAHGSGWGAAPLSAFGRGGCVPFGICWGCKHLAAPSALAGAPRRFRPVAGAAVQHRGARRRHPVGSFARCGGVLRFMACVVWLSPSSVGSFARVVGSFAVLIGVSSPAWWGPRKYHFVVVLICRLWLMYRLVVDWRRECERA